MCSVPFIAAGSSDDNSLYAQIRDPTDPSKPSSRPKARVDFRGRRSIPVPIPIVPVDSASDNPIYSVVGKRASATDSTGGNAELQQRGGSGLEAGKVTMRVQESNGIEKGNRKFQDLFSSFIFIGLVLCKSKVCFWQ